MEVKAQNEEVIVIHLLPETIFNDVVVIEKNDEPHTEHRWKVTTDCPDCIKLGVETPAVIRVFKDRIEMDTVTPRILDENHIEMLLDFKIRHKKFGYDDLLEFNDFIKKVSKQG